MIALDIGLALQHFVDPEAVPLDLYPRALRTALRPSRSGLAADQHRARLPVIAAARQNRLSEATEGPSEATSRLPG
jgi:hypothetical protein